MINAVTILIGFTSYSYIRVCGYLNHYCIRQVTTFVSDNNVQFVKMFSLDT